MKTIAEMMSALAEARAIANKGGIANAREGFAHAVEHGARGPMLEEFGHVLVMSAMAGGHTIEELNLCGVPDDYDEAELWEALEEYKAAPLPFGELPGANG